MVGFYLMHRGWQDNPVFGREPYSRRDAWCWMIEEAMWQERRIDVGGKTTTLKRGQFSHSFRYMAQAWGWSLGRVQDFVGRLKTDTMINTESNTGRIIVTVCNYDKYQSIGDAEHTAEHTEPNTPSIQEAYGEHTNKNEVNEINKGSFKPPLSPLDADFAEWYAAYPRKADPGRAAKAYRAARKIASAADLLAGALRYSAECDGKETQFTKMPASWLNARSWENAPLMSGDRSNGQQKPNSYPGQTSRVAKLFEQLGPDADEDTHRSSVRL